MIAESSEARELLGNVRKYFQRYESLFDIEVEFLKAGQGPKPAGRCEWRRVYHGPDS